MGKERKSYRAWFAVSAAIFAMGAALALDGALRLRRPSPHFDRMVAAAATMEHAERAIAARRAAMGQPADPALDPALTGLVGLEMSPLTTTVGDLESKRTSVNPDFAALAVRYFCELGLKRGDKVAIGSSGSFPGILVAVLSACRSLGLDPEIIASIGSSQYGANIPGLSDAEMLEVLEKSAILPYRPIAISPGGAGDRGQSQFYGLSEIVGGLKFDILRYAKSLKLAPLIEEKSLAEDINARLALYEKYGPAKVFVNIGGSDANYGPGSESLSLPNGIVRDFVLKSNSPGRGLAFEFIARGLPVVNFIDIRGLARRSGIPIDPSPLPDIGTSSVYFDPTTPRWPVALGLLAALALFAAARPNASKESSSG